MNFNRAKKILNEHRAELMNLGVRELSLFGSVARDEARRKSDVDILIDFDSKRGFFVFVNLKSHLEELLNCRVDLVTKGALHPHLKKRILHESKHVF